MALCRHSILIPSNCARSSSISSKTPWKPCPGASEIAIAPGFRAEREIVLADTGEGMDPEVASNIFQPYFTTKAQGTGLGLAICQSIIQGHGGSISVKSTPGKGTAFTHSTATGGLGLVPT